MSRTWAWLAGAGLVAVTVTNVMAADQPTVPRVRPQLAPRARVLPRVEPRAAQKDPACVEHRMPPVKDALPWGPGESLEYTASLKGLPAGTVKLVVGERQDADGRLLYPVTATGEGNALVNLWARMRTSATSHVDPDTAAPVRFVSSTKAEKFTYDEDVRFTGAPPRAEVKTVLNKQPWDRTYGADGDLVDAVSVLFYARSRDFVLGQPFCIDMYQSRVVWRIRGTVSRKETVETDAGPFETFLAEGEARALGDVKGLQAQPRPYKAWMTADADRIPVQLHAPTPWGDVTVKLTRFEQGRRLERSR